MPPAKLPLTHTPSTHRRETSTHTCNNASACALSRSLGFCVRRCAHAAHAYACRTPLLHMLSLPSFAHSRGIARRMARLALGLLLRHVGLHDGHHGALLARLVVHHPESRRRERRRMRGYVKTRRARGEGRGQLRSPRLPLLGGQLEVNQLDPREASSLFLGGLL